MAAPDARLAPCPSTPNCVNSQETGRSTIAPLVFNDSALTLIGVKQRAEGLRASHAGAARTNSGAAA